MNGKNAKLRLVILILSSVFFFTACSGSGNGGGSNDSTPTPSPSPSEILGASSAEQTYRQSIRDMAHPTPDFDVQDGLTGYSNGDFLNNKFEYQYHTKHSFSEVKYDSFSDVSVPTFKIRIDENFSASSPSFSSLPALLFAQKHAGDVKTATEIHYSLSFSDIELTRINELNDIIALDRAKPKTGTKLVYGTYKAQVHMRFSFVNDSSAQIETNASFWQSMLNSNNDINKSTAERKEYEYVLESAAPVSIGYLIRDIDQPRVSIIKPEDVSRYVRGKLVYFEGRAMDDEDGRLPSDSLTWYSDRDKFIKSGASFMWENLSVGEHLITLVAKDSEGIEGSDMVNITVAEPSEKYVYILQPSNGVDYNEGDTIIFVGDSNNPGSGAPAGFEISWLSSNDGQIGTGTMIAVSTLSGDMNTVTGYILDDAIVDSVTLMIAGPSDPKPAITSPSNGATYAKGDTVQFSGTAYDREDGNLSGQALTWLSIMDGVFGTGTNAPTDRLTPGSHTIILLATDSDDNVGRASITIRVEDLNHPVVRIERPENSTSFKQGHHVRFTGDANDSEDGRLTGDKLKWYSNIDGLIGTGSELTTDRLTPGKHVIDLMATDSTGLTGRDDIRITITGRNSPDANIHSPQQNQHFKAGAIIGFSGSGQDSEDGNLSGNSLQWFSSIDGFLDAGAYVNHGLSVGKHTITLVSIDSDGLSGSAYVIVEVADITYPTAVISSPADGQVFKTKNTVTFTGSGLDLEDGNLTGNALVWISNIDGPIGEGVTFSRNDLSTGTHGITLYVTDSDGLTTNISVSIRIDPLEKPTVSIVKPQNRDSFGVGTSITFSGTGVDTEDGTLVGNSLAWISSIDGPIGSGTNFLIDTLSAGSHTITLTATDRDGLTGNAEIDITVNELQYPEASITGPVNGSEFSEGEAVTFSGTGHDAEDRVLSGDSLIWRSDDGVIIGTGTSIQISTLSPGPHTITLTAIDSAGASDEQSVTITIGANQPPVVAINTPANNARFVVGAPITFSGTAIDHEDGALFGDALVWTSNLVGKIGKGNGFDIDSLSIGSHTITLTATDSRGDKGTKQLTVNIENVEAVTFPDANLETAIREALNKPSGVITSSELETITTLSARNKSIIDLNGIDYCTQLSNLDLLNNQISDVGPLSNLTTLTSLVMDSNQIGDVSPFSNLTSLGGLSLIDNQINNVGPLSNLTSLTSLALDSNQIADVDPLSNLTSLNWLSLTDNQIGDVGPLSNLTSLNKLILQSNRINNISPLSNLTSLTSLDLNSNEIGDVGPLSNLTSLNELFLQSNQISDVGPLSNLTSLTFLNLSDNLISDIAPISNLTSLEGLSLFGNLISGVGSLSNLSSLNWLYLNSNKISDIGPLSNLTSLRWLYLDSNQISDVGPLSNLTSLALLYLNSNMISDVSPLINNTGLNAGDRLELNSNPLDQTSCDVHIPQLTARGVIVNHTCP